MTEKTLRFWVNWSTETQIHSNYYTDSTLAIVAVVDEEAGGEIAYFLSEKLAQKYCDERNLENQLK